ncbi:MAG TPA: hypothetical protein VLT45_23370 [Kofleriaceae bacterium]|nr:hypothetical protein [Kofleriaceae bacterium]
MKRALLLMLALAACGDDHLEKAPIDGGTDTAMPDAPMTPATLTSYVIDLVQHHTTATDTPRPYSDFQSLPDPDATNGSAYAPLF